MRVCVGGGGCECLRVGVCVCVSVSPELDLELRRVDTESCTAAAAYCKDPLGCVYFHANVNCSRKFHWDNRIMPLRRSSTVARDVSMATAPRGWVLVYWDKLSFEKEMGGGTMEFVVATDDDDEDEVACACV